MRQEVRTWAAERQPRVPARAACAPPCVHPSIVCYSGHKEQGCRFQAEPARSAADAAARLLPPAASCYDDMWAGPVAVLLASERSILILPAGC